ncbi:zinc knuckle CX2CX4HX4C containing protein [Tanacetum coccineum]
MFLISYSSLRANSHGRDLERAMDLKCSYSSLRYDGLELDLSYSGLDERRTSSLPEHSLDVESLAINVLNNGMPTMAGVDVYTLTMEQYLALSRENQAPGVVKPEIGGNGPIPGMRPAEALTTIQTMADHSQKWHDGTTSRNIESSSSKDGLAALVNKFDNLGRDMKKLKESVHAIQVGCQICEGPHLDKDCPLNEEVKQVEKIDNRLPYAERMQSLEELLAKHQEESARRSTEMDVWIKKLKENVEINRRNQDASLKNLETHIEQLTVELRSRKEKSEEAKVVTIENEEPNSPKKLKNLHGISFLSDSQEENTIDQLPTKESNPVYFMLPYTIDNFNFYAMADSGASVNVLPRNIFEYLGLRNLSETKMLVEMADIRKKAPLGIVKDILAKIDKFLFPSDFVEDYVWSKRIQKLRGNSRDRLDSYSFGNFAEIAAVMA